MSNIRNFSEFLSESQSYDRNNSEWLITNDGNEIKKGTSLAKYAKILKSDSELDNSYANQAYEKALLLKKKFGIDMVVDRVSETSWNYGGHVTVQWTVKGFEKMGKDAKPFTISTGMAGHSGGLTIAGAFEGIPYESRSRGYNRYHSGIVWADRDITSTVETALKKYRDVYGEEFTAQGSKKKYKESFKIERAFKAKSPKLNKLYSEAKQIGKKIGVSLQQYRLIPSMRVVYLYSEVPREFRHSGEYNTSDERNNMYYEFEESYNKYTSEIEKLANKFNVKVDDSATHYWER